MASRFFPDTFDDCEDLFEGVDFGSCTEEDVLAARRDLASLPDTRTRYWPTDVELAQCVWFRGKGDTLLQQRQSYIMYVPDWWTKVTANQILMRTRARLWTRSSHL